MSKSHKKHGKKNDKNKSDKHGKSDEHKRGELLPRTEAIALIEEILAGLRVGTIAIQSNESKAETKMVVPESVYVKIKSKYKKEENKLSIKLIWPNKKEGSDGAEKILEPVALE